MVVEGSSGLLPCQIMALVEDSFMMENPNFGNDSSEKKRKEKVGPAVYLISNPT
jgi:hypothetical protein